VRRRTRKEDMTVGIRGLGHDSKGRTHRVRLLHFEGGVGGSGCVCTWGASGEGLQRATGTMGLPRHQHTHTHITFTYIHKMGQLMNTDCHPYVPLHCLTGCCCSI
jgi:hypothetical protein